MFTHVGGNGDFYCKVCLNFLIVINDLGKHGIGVFRERYHGMLLLLLWFLWIGVLDVIP